MEKDGVLVKSASPFLAPVPVSVPKKKRIRQSTKPLMNRLELEFYEILKQNYYPNSIFAQAIRFKLGNGIWYKPDFIVFGLNVRAYEVKGEHAFRGGFENLKVAASLYKSVGWILVWKHDGQWCEQTVLP